MLSASGEFLTPMASIWSVRIMWCHWWCLVVTEILTPWCGLVRSGVVWSVASTESPGQLSGATAGYWLSLSLSLITTGRHWRADRRRGPLARAAHCGQPQIIIRAELCTVTIGIANHIGQPLPLPLELAFSSMLSRI